MSNIKTLLRPGQTAAAGLTPTALKTAAYTAVVGDLVMVDVSGVCRTARDVQVTNGQAGITSATANFVSATFPAGDVGAPIQGLQGLVQLPATIVSVQSATAATMSASAVITTTVVMSIGPPTGLPVTLPAGAAAGDQVGVRRVDSSGWPLTVVGSGSDTVNGGVSASLARAQTTTVCTKGAGADWSATIVAPTHRTGAVVNAIGDSIAPQGSASSGFMCGSGSPLDYLWWAHILSQGKIVQGYLDGIGGTRVDQMLTRSDAATAAGNWCLIQTGTNEALGSMTPTTWAGYMRQLVAVIVGRGLKPILCTPVPINTAGSRLLMDGYRHWLISFAAVNGYPLVDFYSLLANPLTGAYKSGYDNGDGVHPNPAGKQAMGQLVVDAITPLLPAFNPSLPVVNDTSNGRNLIPNGLFVTDSNSDGVPDSWAKTGSATVSLITDAAVVGQVLRITDSASSGTTTVKAGPITAAGLGGHRFAFTGLVKVVAASAFCDLSCLVTGTGVPSLVLQGLNNWSAIATPGWQRFYVEGNVPSPPSTFTISFSTSGGTSIDVQVGQLGLYDLTALGL